MLVHTRACSCVLVRACACSCVFAVLVVVHMCACKSRSFYEVVDWSAQRPACLVSNRPLVTRELLHMVALGVVWGAEQRDRHSSTAPGFMRGGARGGPRIP